MKFCDSFKVRNSANYKHCSMLEVFMELRCIVVEVKYVANEACCNNSFLLK